MGFDPRHLFCEVGPAYDFPVFWIWFYQNLEQESYSSFSCSFSLLILGSLCVTRSADYITLAALAGAAPVTVLASLHLYETVAFYARSPSMFWAEVFIVHLIARLVAEVAFAARFVFSTPRAFIAAFRADIAVGRAGPAVLPRLILAAHPAEFAAFRILLLRAVAVGAFGFHLVIGVHVGSVLSLL